MFRISQFVRARGEEEEEDEDGGGGRGTRARDAASCLRIQDVSSCETRTKFSSQNPDGIGKVSVCPEEL